MFFVNKIKWPKIAISQHPFLNYVEVTQRQDQQKLVIFVKPVIYLFSSDVCLYALQIVYFPVHMDAFLARSRLHASYASMTSSGSMSTTGCVAPSLMPLNCVRADMNVAPVWQASADIFG